MCACWISTDFWGLTSECIPPLVSANQRTCPEDPPLAMGWTSSAHPRSSSSWCRTWRPPASTHEGQSWEGVLCQVDRTILLALYLDYRAAGETGKINGGMDINWCSKRGISIFLRHLKILQMKQFKMENNCSWSTHNSCSRKGVFYFI